MNAIGFGTGLSVRQRRDAPLFALAGPGLPTGASLSRASAATCSDASGLVATRAADVPRFDYDPVTLAAQGLLCEPAATNLVVRSGALADAAWSLFGSATRNGGVAAPDGSTTAARLNIPTDGSIVQYVGGLSAGVVHTASLWVRQPASGGAGYVRITTNNAAAWSTGQSARFALTPVWQRVSLTGLLSDGAVCNLVIGAAQGDSGLDTGCLGSVEIWGAQLERGNVASSYVPTAGASATRAVDVLTLDWGRLGVADGPRTIRYDFDDGSSAEEATTISGGLAVVPTTLARPRLRSARAC